MFLSSFSQAVFIFFCVEYFLRLATCWAVSAASAGVALRRVYLWEKPEAPLPEPSKPMQVRLRCGTVSLVVATRTAEMTDSP